MIDEEREQDAGDERSARKVQRGEAHGRRRLWGRVPVTDEQRGGMRGKTSQEIPQSNRSAVSLLAIAC